MIFFKLRQYSFEKILKNIFFCCPTASLGGKGLRSLIDFEILLIMLVVHYLDWATLLVWHLALKYLCDAIFLWVCWFRAPLRYASYLGIAPDVNTEWVINAKEIYLWRTNNFREPVVKTFDLPKCKIPFWVGGYHLRKMNWNYSSNGFYGA